MKQTARFVLLALFSMCVALASYSTVPPARAAERSSGAGAVLDAAGAEQLRIRAHLAQAERELRAVEASSLSPSARTARARALDALHEYWQRGVFPRNTRHPGQRVPYFIDDGGRACAMAYLIQASGATALAEAVRVRENNARIAEMKTDLGPWLDENGLTAAEAARIQPSYEADCTCGDIYNLVCAEVRAVDGGVEERTFLNECMATACGDTRVLHAGECKPDDELTDPTCGDGVCTGEHEGCSLGLAPARPRSLGSASALGAGMLGFLVVLLRRRRRRAPR